ncbi:hypothetical protein AMTR_s00023p00196060 [Amborella trichopoda]|uniref:SAP domain-containing protein n=2 Tax=Amborella trichopoda TaxID=13333 RepID=W1NKD7_AMBTC|nr:hypothetical protein AMTR_s00023p00196060 [Amborella trichopoda]
MSTDLQKMKVKDLREELAKRGLDTAGLKAILIERLESSVSPSSSSATALASASASTPPPPSQQESSSTAQQERPQNQVQAKGEGGSEENGEDRETKPLVVAGNPSVSTGPISEIEKKYKRAERFGMPVQLSEQEKRKSRAER